MFTEKGKNLLVRNDFEFHFHKPFTDVMQREACTDKKCKAFMKRFFTGYIIDDSKADVHNHELLTAEVLEKQRKALDETVK